jgi:tetratricopeptide (TPR) repeat protein
VSIITNNIENGKFIYEKALRYGDISEIGCTYLSNLRNVEGLMWWVKGEAERSLECFLVSLGVFVGVSQKRGVALAQLGCGRARIRLGQYELGERDLHAARAYFGSLSDARNEAMAYEQLALLYHKTERLDMAKEYLSRSEKIRRLSKSPLWPIDVEEIGQLYKIYTIENGIKYG